MLKSINGGKSYSTTVDLNGQKLLIQGDPTKNGELVVNVTIAE